MQQKLPFCTLLTDWVARTALVHNAGTRAQATPAAVAVRHGYCGSQSTWPSALPLSAARWWAMRRARKGAAC